MTLSLDAVLRQSVKVKRPVAFPLSAQVADLGWTLAQLTTKDTTYVSHGYHRYPAKFIPQLARKIIERYSTPGSLVIDPFMGSGTSVLEGLLSGRRVAGTDVNPVAVLITRAKLRPLPPAAVKEATNGLLGRINAQVAEEVNQQLPLKENAERVDYALPTHERLVYWYPDESVRRELAIILAQINELADPDLKRFCLCAFSHILKNTSIWLNKSTKPTREFTKKIPAPTAAFQRQLRKMVNRNREFYYLMDSSVYERLNDFVNVKEADARCQAVGEGEAELVVTSPPYVTSYEYADLHQLSALWFEETTSLVEFRRQFIGSSAKRQAAARLLSPLAVATVAQLELENAAAAASVRGYFLEMQECFVEMRRVLKDGGKAAIVIGNTTLRGVPILNAEIFVETMEALDFRIYDIIKRMIPAKILPQTRDQKSGRFAAKKTSDAYAYPHEFIVVMEKTAIRR